MKRLAVWNTGKILKNSEGIFVRDTLNNNDLEIAKLGEPVEDPEAPDGKALAFYGDQTAPAMSKKDLSHGPNIEFTLKAKLQNKDTDGLLVALGAFELRHFPKRGSLALIVWYKGDPDRKTVEIQLPAATEKWLSLTGSVQNGKVILKVDDKSIEGDLPPDTTMDILHSKLRVGHGAGRPFVGSLADIHLGYSLD
jgi:hypothetical protein